VFRRDRCGGLLRANSTDAAAHGALSAITGLGGPTATTIPKGTAVSFAARLLNGGAYCTTVPAPEPILPHLFVVITGLYGPPLFDDQAPCQAWRETTPEVEP